MTEQTFPREIADKIFWINQCMGAGDKDFPFHLHLSLFLLKGDTSTMLVDTSMQTLWNSVEKQLDEALDDRPLDYLFVTHPELPHSAALPLYLEKYPDMKVIGDMRDYHLYFPDHVHRFHHLVAGDTMDLGDLQVEFLEGHIKDLPGTLWAFEKTRQAMFVCDGFSFTHESPVMLDSRGLPLPTGDDDDEEEEAPYHMPGDCALVSSEIATGVDVDKAAFLLRRALYWARFVDADKLFGDVEEILFKTMPTKLICPSHGNVIDNLEVVTPVIKQSHVRAYETATADKNPGIAAPK